MYASILALVATILYTPSVILICINAMKKMAKDPEKIGVYQSKMFIQAAGAEFVAIVLIVLSFVQLENGSAENIYLYFLALGIIVVFSLLYLFMEHKQIIDGLKKRNEDVPHIKVLLPISIALSIAVPIIAFIIFMIQLTEFSG